MDDVVKKKLNNIEATTGLGVDIIEKFFKENLSNLDKLATGTLVRIQSLIGSGVASVRRKLPRL